MEDQEHYVIDDENNEEDADCYTTDEENDEEDEENKEIDEENDEKNEEVQHLKMSWSEEEINQMEAKFQEFLDKKQDGALRWDLKERKITFRDELKEEEYWMMRFKHEYIKLRDDKSEKQKILVANIHLYIYYVTDKKMIGSSKYPDDLGVFNFFDLTITYYPKHNLTVKNSDDEKYEPGAVKEMNERFEEFMCKFNDGSLNWDFNFGLCIEDNKCKADKFGSFDESERNYWFSRFKEEYRKVQKGEDDKDCELVAAMHVYIYYCTVGLLLGSQGFPDDLGCLKHLEERIVYLNQY